MKIFLKEFFVAKRKAISLLTLLAALVSANPTMSLAGETSCNPEVSSVFVGCNFNDADLSGKSFQGAIVANSNFSGANLQSTDFSGVNLSSNIFSPTTNLVNANLSEANLSGLDLSSINLSGSVLTSANMSGANLTNVNLSSANLSNANLSRANLTNVTMNSTTVFYADFSEADLSGVYARDIIGSPLALPADWRQSGGYLIGPNANLSNIYFGGQNFNNMNLTGVNLSNSNLSDASLINTNLSGANLTNTSLYSANLTNTNFTAANLTSTNLTWAYINGTNFTNATLTSISRECASGWDCYYYYNYGWRDGERRYRIGFDSATFDGVKSSNIPKIVEYSPSGNGYDYRYCWWWGWTYCKYTYQIQLPSGWVNLNGVLFGKNVDLSGKNLSGWDLSRVDLSNVNFADSVLSRANFSSSTLINADFSGKDLTGANFSSANLTGANFSGANLTGVTFNGATLTGANLSGADLSNIDLSYVTSGAIIGDITGLPSGWKFINGYLVGRTARLYNSDLSGADLTGMDLTSVQLANANLRAVNLTNSTLTDSNLSGANLDQASLEGVSSGSISCPSNLPADWKCMNGYLVGPKANLRGANFTWADLRYANLTGVDLTNARFDYADLRSTNFNGANLNQASMYNSKIAYTDFTNARVMNVNLYCGDYWNCGYWSYNGPMIFDHTLGWGLDISGGYGRQMPSNWTIRNGVLLGPTANLSGTTINQVNFGGLDLSSADFSEANLNGVDFSSSNLSNANFRGANMTGVILNSANLINANLSDSTLTAVKLRNTSLDNANLSGVRSKALDSPSTLPSGWIIANGSLIGPSAIATNINLAGANLSGMNLAGIDLSNSNLSKANLRGVDLTGANLKNSNLNGSDITGANIDSTNLEGVVFGDLVAADVVGLPMNIPMGWTTQGGKFIGTIFLNNVTVSGNLEWGQTLTAGVSSNTPNVNYTYKWYRNGVQVSDANTRQYLIGVADVGATIRVEVIASKDNFISASKESDSVLVPNTFADLQNLDVQGQAVKDGSLSLSASGYASFSTLSYQVSRDGGRSWSTMASPNYDVQFRDIGGVLNFRVVQSAAGYISQVTEFSSITVDGTFSLPGYSQGTIDGANSGNAVQGSSTIGSSLKVEKTVWPSNTRVSSFWWSSNGVAVSTKNLYRSVASDIGATLTYVEVGVTSTGETRYRLSSPIVVTPNLFVNSSKPILTGNTTISSRLKAVVSSNWASGAKYSWQWLSDGTEIAGATTSSYTITADDLDTSISVRVCATKPTFAQKCEESLGTPTIAKSQITHSVKPLVKFSSTKLGKLLSASTGRWLSGVTFTFEWLRDGEVVSSGSQSSYIMTSADEGHQMSVRVTGSKPGYLDLSKTSDAKIYK